MISRFYFHSRASVNVIFSNLWNTSRLQERYYSMEGQQNGVTLKFVTQKLKEFASTALAESWDNVGLLLEPATQQTITRILLTNDLTEDVMDEALLISANLIISYHPPIFVPLTRITNAKWKERIVSKCLANNIAIYSPHTSWDVVQGGVNDWLASAFTCSEVKPLIRKENPNTERKTLVAQEDALNPQPSVNEAIIGIGRMCKLEKPISIREAVGMLKKHIGTPFVQLALARNSTAEDLIETVAFVAGSGGSLLKNVFCDLKVTGEASHHEILDSVHNGSSVILTNHSNSERGFLWKFKEILATKLNNSSVQIVVSTKDEDPLKVF